MQKQNNEYWDIEISSSTKLLDLKLSEIWKHRDLLKLLVKRDFISFYKQTILGPLWFFIQPAFSTLIFTLIFGNLAGISTDGLPKPLFYLAGVTSWNYFADCLNKTSTVFRDNTNLFGKVYFPRLIMPVSIVLSALIRFGVQLLLFIIVLIYYIITGSAVQPSWYLILLLPLNILLMASLGLGLGMIISAMTTKYRDLAFIVAFGTQLLMYATPVIYPLSVAMGKYPDYAWIIACNPMTPIIESLRYGFLGAGSFSWESMGSSSLVTTLVTITGIIAFNKAEKTFVDTV